MLIKKIFLSSFFFLATAIFSTQLAFSQEQLIQISPETWDVKKVTFVSMSPSIYTRIPVTEDYLNKHGCKSETDSTKRIAELKNILARSITTENRTIGEPTDLRIAIYLILNNGNKKKYLLTAQNREEVLYGHLHTTSSIIPITAKSSLLNSLRKWAESYTPPQKNLDSCF